QIEMFLDIGLEFEVEKRFQSWEECIDRFNHGASPRQKTRPDPIVLAKQLTDRLRRHDKQTRIRSQANQCGPVFQEIQNVVGQVYNQTMGTFEMSFSGKQYPKGKTLPAEIDQVTDVRTITIILQPHELVCEINYMLGA